MHMGREAMRRAIKRVPVTNPILPLAGIRMQRVIIPQHLLNIHMPRVRGPKHMGHNHTPKDLKHLLPQTPHMPREMGLGPLVLRLMPKE